MRSSEIENACMVVRTPVARAAAAIGTRTRYRGSAARGRRRVFIWSPELGEVFPRCPGPVGHLGKISPRSAELIQTLSD